MIAAARFYGATYLILDENHPLPLTGLYEENSSSDLELIKTIETVQIYRLNDN